jgi:hypothetical protein
MTERPSLNVHIGILYETRNFILAFLPNLAFHAACHAFYVLLLFIERI